LAYAQICQQEKIGDFVDFPVTGLDMGPYMQMKSEDNSSLYDLYAISNHFGSLNGGHYTAYGFNPLKMKWYEFNDSSCSSVGNPENVVTNGAYLLFYRRRE
jgi:ubiquitin C-terminal hydrolase